MSIPIVFTSVGDPVATGLVNSLARPGGNATGMSVMVADLTPKRLELIQELVPRAATIAVLVDPSNTGDKNAVKEIQDAGNGKGVHLNILTASSEGELAAAFASLTELRAGGLVVGADPFFTVRRETIVKLAARHVWMAPASQEISIGAVQLSLAVMCPARCCSPVGLLALMGAAHRGLIIRAGSGVPMRRQASSIASDRPTLPSRFTALSQALRS